MSTYPLRKKLIAIAEKEVGVREVPRNSNKGKRVQEYQRATWLDGTGWPYCAAFVCWCVREWLKIAEVRNAFGFTATQAEKWRPKTPAAYGFHDWAEEKGLFVIDENETPGQYTLHTADIVTFDFSHVGLLRTDEGSTLYTVEGNTDAGGSREGGGVYAKERHRITARKFIRLLP